MALTLRQISMELYKLPPNAKLALLNRLSYHLVQSGKQPRNEDKEEHEIDYWSRLVMNQTTAELVSSLQPETLKVLEISGDAWGKRETFKEYKSLHFPDFDICETALEEKFDLIIAEQVFEHLLWPYKAARNVYEMLNPGGHFLVTTPFMIKLHPIPHDCTRWTETGLNNFLIECGFPDTSIRTGAWGNRACALANFFDWVEYNPLTHSLKNEADVPVAVWALAKK